MKHTHLYNIMAVAATLLWLATAAPAQHTTDAPIAYMEGIVVNSCGAEQSGKFMSLDLNADIRGLKVKRNRAVVIVPRLIAGPDSASLTAVGVYGRRRYFQSMRRTTLTFADGRDRSIRSRNAPATLEWHGLLPYEEWMNGSDIVLYRYLFGCCEQIIDVEAVRAGTYFRSVFEPEFLFVPPEAEAVKARSLEGSAFIDFPVNRTNIDPDYRRNPVELAKINATIDSVRYDRDVTITGIRLKGFASPEGPYLHNTELAIGRVTALQAYVQNLHHFPLGIISTDYEPEDWAGLRRYVETCDQLPHREEILSLIDAKIDPDAKEDIIKRTCPSDYGYLLANCYPALRHTDYRISYEVKTYVDVDEMKRVLATQPYKLSLNELYLIANSYETGSDDFNEVLETAARMYPDDEVANINAANSAMKRGEMASAKRHLDKAGDSPEAVYARGLYAYLCDDYETARVYLPQAEAAGIEQATALLREMDLKERHGKQQRTDR